MRPFKLLVLVLILTLGIGIGCHKNTVTAPLPGAINSFDQTSYTALMQVQAALNAVKADVASGKFVPGPTEKRIINQGIQDYDLAEEAWQAYHAGISNDTVALANAINQVITDIVTIADPGTTAPARLQGGSK